MIIYKLVPLFKGFLTFGNGLYVIQICMHERKFGMGSNIIQCSLLLALYILKICVFMWAHVCVAARGQFLVSFLWSCPPWCLRQYFSVVRNFLSKLDLLSVRFRVLSISTSPVLVYKLFCYTCFTNMDFGDRSQVFGLVQAELPPQMEACLLFKVHFILL